MVTGYIALFFARRTNGVPGFYERIFGALTYTYNFVNQIMGSIHPTWPSANQIWSLFDRGAVLSGRAVADRLDPGCRTVGPVSLLLTVLLLWALPLYAGLALGVLMAASLMRSQATTSLVWVLLR